MNKFAIYTAVVGNYDEIRQPLVVDSRFDYFLFSNTIKEKQIGVWQIKPIEYTNPDQVKIARYVKTHPETLLPDYTATLWMDANIQIIDTWVYERFIELYQNGSQIASVKHPGRDCIYEEIFAVCSFQYETLEVAHKWNHFLRLKNYPRHNGLFETNLMYRTNSKNIRIFDECWWFYIENYSRRDQLSFNYALWERKEVCHVFFMTSDSVKTSPHFEYIKHPNRSEQNKIVKNAHYLARLWDYYNEDNYKCKNKFINRWLLVLSLPLPLTKLFFYLWRQTIRVKKDVLRYLKING